MVTLRPVIEADYPQIVALINAQTGGQTMTLEQYAENVRKSAGHEIVRLAAFLPDGRFAGYGLASADYDQGAHCFGVSIRIDETYRRQGVGTEVLAALTAWVRERDGIRLLATLNTEQKETLEWAARRGFVTEGDVQRSELKLEGWAPGPFLNAVTEAESRGIRFVTLAEVGASDENLRRFHGFCNELLHDIPGRGPHLPREFETWRAQLEGNPTWDPACILLALDGDQWAALSFFEKQPDGSWYTYLTGVHPDHRGKGLGTAIKVAAVRLAVEQNVPYLSTFNHLVNAPMIAINQQLGYQPVFTLRQIHLPL